VQKGRKTALRTATLRARLLAAAAGAILAAVAVFAVATVLLVGHQLRSSLDGALRQRAEDVAQLAVSAPAVLTDPGGLESPVSGRQITVEVIDARGRILARSLSLGARLLPLDRVARDAMRDGRSGFETFDSGDQRQRLYAAPIAQAGGPAAGGAVLVASDTSDITHTVHHLAFVIALSGVAVALVAMFAAAALIRRGLRPLRELAGAAGEIERTADPSRRLPDAGAGDEIGQLTGVLNRMLGSLERARTGERRFLADASHELRTPVTTLRGNIEYAARHGADDEVLADLQRDAVRLSRLVDDLLVLEREGSAPDVVPLALDELAADAVRDHATGDGRLRLGALAHVEVTGDEDALRRALGNLIENALVHGPADGAVEVTLTRNGGCARLSVRDDGPGPAPEERERVFERFWRGAGAGERPGSGLGLSIVAAIAERHGGSVEVDGSTFTLTLPVAGGRGHRVGAP
jgi:two-component system, OmpR family, sensor kinase